MSESWQTWHRYWAATRSPDAIPSVDDAQDEPLGKSAMRVGILSAAAQRAFCAGQRSLYRQLRSQLVLAQARLPNRLAGELGVTLPDDSDLADGPQRWRKIWSHGIRRLSASMLRYLGGISNYER